MGPSGMVGNVTALRTLIDRIGRMSASGAQRNLLARARDVLGSQKPPRVAKARAARSRTRGKGARFGAARRTDAARRAFATSLRKAAAQAFSSLLRR